MSMPEERNARIREGNASEMCHEQATRSLQKTLLCELCGVFCVQEQKWRRQQGLDGLPPWSVESEGLLAEAMVNALHGVCFCTVKH